MTSGILKLNSRQLTVCLSIGLTIKASSIFGQDEDFVGYRHELYQEDTHRMKINTDTSSFDVGLGDHLRFTGQLVQDAISGATPTGAPPQSQWPFPTYANFYNQDYNQVFRAAVNNPNNLILFQSGYFPNFQAYTNYVAQNNPQLRTQASNSAAASFKALTNSPSYHKNSVPLTYLHDLRNSMTFSTPITVGVAEFVQKFIPEVSLIRTGKLDYDSLGLALNYSAEGLNQKNTTLNAGWSHNADLVRDDTLQHWRPKATDEFLIGFNQLLTPKSLFDSGCDTYGQEHGYLSDPYRGVMALENFPQLNPEDASLIPENRPPFSATKEIFTPATRNSSEDPAATAASTSATATTMIPTAFLPTRLKRRGIKSLGRHIVVTPSFRYYEQTAARFYYVLVPDFDNLPTYYSSDYRLSELRSPELFNGLEAFYTL